MEALKYPQILIKALRKVIENNGHTPQFLEAVEDVNDRQN